MHWNELEAWCKTWLGAIPTQTIFEASHLSQVTGLQLADGREVVVKARPWEDRLKVCTQVQQHLWKAGFPCPETLVGPVRLRDQAISAETYIPGGEELVPSPDSPRLFAEALAQLVRLAPSPTSLPNLAPSPPWVWWDHQRPELWPPPDDRDTDLNKYLEPAWIDEVGLRARQRLACHRQEPVVGHGDWESQNIRWTGRSLHVVYDWDSVVSQPEAAVVGRCRRRVRVL